MTAALEIADRLLAAPQRPEDQIRQVNCGTADCSRS